MTINIKNLLKIVVILLLLPNFCFIIGFQFIPFYIPIILIFFFIMLLFFNQELVKDIIAAYKNTPFKFLLMFFLWAFFTIILSIIKGKFFLQGFINSTIGGLIASVFLPCILTIFLVPKYINIHTAIRVLYIYIWLVIILGIIDFFIFYFDIPVLKEIITIFSNKRLLVYNLETSRVFVGNFPRARSIFDEPSGLGFFILTTSPLVYEWTLTKYRIFKNKYLNLIIKRTIIPFMFFALILTQSPIFLIFTCVFSLIYFLFLRKGYRIIIKHFLLFSSIMVFIGLIFTLFICKIDFSGTYLNRIILVVQNIKDFNDFIAVEPSLGTRVIVFVNTIKIGIDNIFFGVGYGNMPFVLANQLIKSPLNLTPELQNFVLRNATNPCMMIFAKLFSETGLIGLFLFYSFLFQLQNNLNIIKKYYTNHSSILNGFKLFIIVYMCISVYSSSINQPYIFVIIGLIIGLIIKFKINYKKENQISNKIC